MPQQVGISAENNFTKGLITEATGLNFPENAATDCLNCEFTLVGDVKRRLGIDIETGGSTLSVNRTGNVQASYVWNNVGGDGFTRLMVVQIGNVLRFYDISAATTANPLSDQLLGSIVTVSDFVNGTFNPDVECEFADGNGYLFVYHENCNPFYCTYNAGTITGNIIDIKIRDFVDVVEPGIGVNVRPLTNSVQHSYNLSNRGWQAGSPWFAQSTGSGPAINTGSQAFTVAAGITGIVLGTPVQISNVNQQISVGFGVLAAGTSVMSGTVTAYAGTTLTVNVTGTLQAWVGASAGPYSIVPLNNGYVDTWFTAVGNIPSRADVWWYFKNTSGNFDPATRVNQVTLNTGSAPTGHFILPAFNQDRGLAAGLPNLTNVFTSARPRTGTWFQGRVWYTGVDASFIASGTANFYTWTEKIYFSKVVENPEDLGSCFQTNDPTSENLFDLLPTDGGVIAIQGAGPIYKLFSIQNGLLVFAENGVWFITGSQGIGFTANDYTITKLSNIKTIGSKSFVNVEGLPYFWGEDGIYSVQPQQGGGLAVINLTSDTIDTFYSEIPLSSKKLARGDYDPFTHTLKWIYKTTEATSVVDSYNFDGILNYNIHNKAFYPYLVGIEGTAINSVRFVYFASGAGIPTATFKYLCSTEDTPTVWALTFADERDTAYEDWGLTTIPEPFTSYFITGYRLRGKGITKFQPQYVQVYSRTNGENGAYKIQGLWNYANSGNSGKWSSLQVANIDFTNKDVVFKRHKIRGLGYALQFKITSMEGQPFDIIGWAVIDTINQGA